MVSEDLGGLVDSAQELAAAMEEEYAFRRWLEKHCDDDEDEESSSSISYKVFRIVCFLGSVEVLHDVQDLLEFGVRGVLGWYGVHCLLTEREELELGRFLFGMGEELQTREMVGMVLG